MSSTTLKVWSLGKLYLATSMGSSPQPARSHRVYSPKLPESEVTALAVHDHEDGHTVVALGLASGMVYWFSGDLGECGAVAGEAPMAELPWALCEDGHQAVV